MQHLIVEVGILHVLQPGLNLESTLLSGNGGILGKDARVQKPELPAPECSQHDHLISSSYRIILFPLISAPLAPFGYKTLW